MRCRYTDCLEGHPVAGEDDPITCPTCRRELGLPDLPSAFGVFGDRACTREAKLTIEAVETRRYVVEFAVSVPEDATDGEMMALCARLYEAADADDFEPAEGGLAFEPGMHSWAFCASPKRGVCTGIMGIWDARAAAYTGHVCLDTPVTCIECHRQIPESAGVFVWDDHAPMRCANDCGWHACGA